jgi:hypothetical protein
MPGPINAKPDDTTADDDTLQVAEACQSSSSLTESWPPDRLLI